MGGNVFYKYNHINCLLKLNVLFWILDLLSIYYKYIREKLPAVFSSTLVTLALLLMAAFKPFKNSSRPD